MIKEKIICSLPMRAITIALDDLVRARIAFVVCFFKQMGEKIAMKTTMIFVLEQTIVSNGNQCQFSVMATEMANPEVASPSFWLIESIFAPPR